MAQRGVAEVYVVTFSQFIISAAVFICDISVKYQFFGVIIQSFSCVIEFTAVETLAINEFSDLCDELAGQFESRFFAFYVS